MTSRWLWLATLILLILGSRLSQLKASGSVMLPHRGVAILETPSKRVICHGVLIDKQSVLTSRHCFASNQPKRFGVKIFPNVAPFPVLRLEYLVEDSRHFPNHDLAKIILAKPVDEAILGPLRLAPSEVSKGEVFWSKGTANVIEFFNGPIIKALARIVAREPKTFCVGDSGSPIWIKAKGEWQLLGLMTGLWEPLTSEAGPCASEVLITRLEPYHLWIHLGKQPFPPKSKESVYQSFSELCHRTKPGDSDHLVLQQILNQMMEVYLKENKKSEAIALYNSCSASEAVWKDGWESKGSFNFEFGFELARFPFLQKVIRLSLVNVSSGDLEALSQFSRLETLTLTGKAESLDLSALKKLRLKKLELKNIHDFRGLEEFLRSQKELEDIFFVDVRWSQSSSIKLSWFKEMNKLRRLRLSLTPLERDMELTQPGIELRIR